jgi:RNA polymerase sigma-70 factor (ECF subfamily)
MTQQLSLETLVRRSQQTLPEDPRSFEQLVAAYRQQVYATAYRLMGNREDAEDQAQEVFLKVFHNIHDLEEPATFPAWLSRITVTTCLNALKQRQRRGAMTLPEEFEDMSGNAAWDQARPLTPEQVALARELKECIESALLDLDAGERAVLVLRELEECSYQEIADMLRIGLSAVKMRIRRARLAFQQLFLQLCPGLWRPNEL